MEKTQKVPRKQLSCICWRSLIFIWSSYFLFVFVAVAAPPNTLASSHKLLLLLSVGGTCTSPSPQSEDTWSRLMKAHARSHTNTHTGPLLLEEGRRSFLHTRILTFSFSAERAQRYCETHTLSRHALSFCAGPPLVFVSVFLVR